MKSLYQKFLDLRRSSEIAQAALAFVQTNGRFRTFEEHAILVAPQFKKTPIRIERYWTLDLTAEEVETLKANDVKIVIAEAQDG